MRVDGNPPRWKAFYQADGEMLHTVGDYKHAHMAAQHLADFIARIPTPTVQVWWAWIESESGEKITWEQLQETATS